MKEGSLTLVNLQTIKRRKVGSLGHVLRHKIYQLLHHDGQSKGQTTCWTKKEITGAEHLGVDNTWGWRKVEINSLTSSSKDTRRRKTVAKISDNWNQSDPTNICIPALNIGIHFSTFMFFLCTR